MNVLAIAFSIKPGSGSEPAVGWTWVNEIAKVASHVTVLVRDAEGQREAIEEYTRRIPMPNVDFLYYELPGKLRNLVRGETWTRQVGMRRYYIVWQIFSLFFLKKKLDLKKIDIVHHVTFPVDWLPSFYTLAGVRRLVLGPLGSHSMVSKALNYPVTVLLKDRLANTIKFAMRWFNPLFRYNMIKADAVIGISPETQRKIGTKHLARKFYHIPGVSVPAALQPNAACFPKSVSEPGELIIFTSGRFIYWKNFDLAVEAFAEYKKMNPKARLLIAGDGTERGGLIALAKKLNVEDSVEFLGWLNTEEVFNILRDRAHIFLFPTSESGGTASVEAMRCGVPVVCMEGYGYNYFVKRSKGSRAVPIRYRAQVVKDLAHAVDRVAQHLPEYSRGALEESEAFLPERKRELIEEIYKTIMEEIR
jgi:glycosyltransferase involved in cell wall biosynthesis